MDKEKDSQIETAEELAAEKDHLADVKEEEVRSGIIKDFGFDPETDKERIDKLVQKEMTYKKAISTAIGQKVKYRNTLKELSDKNTHPKTKESEKDSKDVDVNTAVNEALEKERLEDMEYPDDIKAIIKNVAIINKISVKKAAQDDYVQSRIEKWRKDSGADEAAAGRRHQSSKSGGTDDLDIPDFDLTTKEGRDSWDSWKKDQKAKGN